MKPDYRATFPSSHRAAVTARRAIRAYAQGCGFLGDALSDIESAVGEALANAAEHGHRPGASFTVNARIEHHRHLVIEVEDEGIGFDPATAREREPVTDSPRGFGIFIMRSFMDEIEYSPNGTRVRMRKTIPSANESAEGATG